MKTMVSETAQYVAGLVRDGPGHYMRNELVREVRRHLLDKTGADPGIPQAKAYVDEAFSAGNVKEEHNGIGMRCYPTTS